ncbi:carotenoid ester lipase precursor [Pilatotrama ljubarskyi]|nr:carotenoid ester lipase precursor [Pilatotrama ljubarskyi]
MFIRSLCLLPALAGAAFAAPFAPRAAPTVQLDQGTFIGTTDGTTNKFLGIPFAKAPVGDLRFNLPVAVDPYTGTHTVTSFGPSCPQQAVNFDLPSALAEDAVNYIVNSIFQAVFPSDEDCLSINVMVPAGTKANAKLPVVAWIFGGGFELGSPSMYDGGSIVSRSVELGEPVIYVSMNYRVSAFGFLASQEVKDAGVGNLGLQDQRLALQWIQRYISAFGGDPTKVTIWGESAGAISVALHLLTNGGNPDGLFRGAFMQSGSPIPVGDITHGQSDYDALVAQTGCTGAADTLNCLRQVPYAKLKKAVDASPGIFAPQSLRLTWLPRVDGKFLVDAPQRLVQQGVVANVPFVTGDCDDEGTLFSLSTLNITTSSDLRAYIVSNYLPAATSSELDQLMAAYPEDITQGSPFDTGILNALTPQYKRLAAMQGDLVFQAPRRFLLQNRSGKQPMWSFLHKRLKGLPALGAAHATDILNIYGGGELADYLINFANNLDPNGKTVPSWPQYSTSSPKLLTFLDGLDPMSITQDDFRVEAMNVMTKLALDHPL